MNPMTAAKLDEMVSRIPSAFDKAKASGDLLFYPSTVHIHAEAGVEYEIRLCPTLQHKPGLPNPHFDVPSGHVPARVDPFAQPYTPNLFIGEVRDEEEDADYVLLLNKFSVVPQHFVTVIKQYQSQASPLSPADLVHIYWLLLALQKAGKRYIAFYNCGDDSGASQPHKHMQLLPLSDGVDAPPIERVTKATRLETHRKPFALSSLPYANHIFRLPPITTSTSRSELQDVLTHAYLSLLDLVISTVRHDPEHRAGTPSYNVIITLEHMHLIPRKREGYILPGTGKLAVNSLGFAGMLLVRSEEELQAVKNEGIGKILRGVAFESVHDAQVACGSVEAEPNP